MAEAMFEEVFARTGMPSNDDEFRAFLAKDGYTHVRKLDDGTWVGLVKLLFTTGLCIGLDPFGWAQRYDYDSPARAIIELLKIERGDQIPTGWIDKRPE